MFSLHKERRTVFLCQKFFAFAVSFTEGKGWVGEFGMGIDDGMGWVCREDKGDGPWHLGIQVESEIGCFGFLLGINKTSARWFKMTFSSPSWRSLHPLKGSLNHPKKVTKNCQVVGVFFYRLNPKILSKTNLENFGPHIKESYQCTFLRAHKCKKI